MKLRANLLTIPRVTVESGREYDRIEVERRCLTCDGPHTPDCERQNHRLKRRQDVTVIDKAPDEANRARTVYRQIHARLAELGHPCGGSVYLIPRERRGELDSWVAQSRDAVRAFNEGAAVARLTFFCDVAEIDPATAHDEALRSIEDRVRQAIDGVLAALRSRDASEIRRVSRETANLGRLIEGEAAAHVGELASFAVLTARRLRDAAKESEDAAAQAAHEALAGAQRFSAIFADVFGGADAPAAIGSAS